MNTLERQDDTGLGAMLAAAEPGDHVVLADWIEEHLQLDDLAAVLRISGDDPRSGKQVEQTGYTGFRYRLLDRNVLLYAAHFRVWGSYVRGKKQPTPEGHVLGLCLASWAPGGPTQFVRWLPTEVPGEAFARVWQELGQGRPANPNEQS